MRALAAALLVTAGAVTAETPLPFDVGGAFALTDQHGQTRTQADPDGHPQLLFFGYANCPGICTAAMPLMAGTVDTLAEQGITVRPVMITVDPARDTVDNMEGALRAIHPDFIGLTGDADALDVAYDAFSIEHTLAFEDPHYGPVYTHGSFVYLLDGAGEVLTLLPPVIDTPTAVGIVLKYIGPDA